MLHTEAHGKILGLHFKTGFKKFFYGIPCRVPYGEDDLSVLISLLIIGEPGVEPDFSPKSHYFLSDILNDIYKLISTYMRL